MEGNAYVVTVIRKACMALSVSTAIYYSKEGKGPGELPRMIRTCMRSLAAACSDE